MTRRRLLGSAARVAALAAASSILPPSLRRVLAQEPPRKGSLRDIKHVVLLMQENRSFDHYFGTMAGVRGFDDATAMKLSNGQSVFHQPDPKNPNGYLLPFHLDTRTTTLKKFLDEPLIGPVSMTPGMEAKWTIGCPRIARSRAPKLPT